MQLINKTAGIVGGFTTDDEDVMSIFLSIAGPLLANSNLYSQLQGRGKNTKENEERPNYQPSSSKQQQQ